MTDTEFLVSCPFIQPAISEMFSNDEDHPCWPQAKHLNLSSKEQ